MSVQDEIIVRTFLNERMIFWQTMDYDWLEMHEEILDSANVFPIPDEVLEAYRRTRSDPECHARDADDYGKILGYDKERGGWIYVDEYDDSRYELVCGP